VGFVPATRSTASTGFFKEVSSDGRIAQRKDRPGSLHSRADLLRVPPRILAHRPIYHLGSLRTGKGSWIADALLRLLMDFEGSSDKDPMCRPSEP
jgi:hypothetical protein